MLYVGPGRVKAKMGQVRLFDTSCLSWCSYFLTTINFRAQNYMLIDTGIRQTVF